eukprot:TRINITY_DN11764_c0_g1_i1.p1 TRINITY_DN11764_c0_g1~~TRINITY_DN11764_c0_g1_i1.p1  ORF type:complete len:235 (+),score=61.43 TRINITY_DN11764_c0_g1_i1:132-836(+)
MGKKSVLIVLSHPSHKSYNFALFERAVETFEAKGYDVMISDLYAMKWDPVSDERNYKELEKPEEFNQQTEDIHADKNDLFADEIKIEQEKAQKADFILFLFPLFWGAMPAMLKGWIDRVFSKGFAYGSMIGGKALKGKKGMAVVTTGGPKAAYGEKGLIPLDCLLIPLTHATFGFVGMKALPTFMVNGPAKLSMKDRVKELDRFGECCANIESLKPVATESLLKFVGKKMCTIM